MPLCALAGKKHARSSTLCLLAPGTTVHVRWRVVHRMASLGSASPHEPHPNMASLKSWVVNTTLE